MNNFAVTNDDMAEALRRSASSFQTANTTLDESMALLTGVVEITRDAASAGKVCA